MLQGQFSNTFSQANLPNWPVKEEPAGEAQKKKEEAPKEEKADMSDPKPGRLIVIGCAKMFNDDLITNSGNLNLFINIIDGLTLGDNIIKIRSKSYVSRDIKRIADIQKIYYRFFTIFLVPILLAAWAVLRLFLRGKEKQFYAMAAEK